jgi:hypothetical protein
MKAVKAVKSSSLRFEVRTLRLPDRVLHVGAIGDHRREIRFYTKLAGLWVIAKLLVLRQNNDWRVALSLVREVLRSPLPTEKGNPFLSVEALARAYK